MDGTIKRSQTHDGLEVGSFKIQPNGKLMCSKGHLGAVRVWTKDLLVATASATRQSAAPEFKCKSCNEIGLAFDHGTEPLKQGA